MASPVARRQLRERLARVTPVPVLCSLSKRGARGRLFLLETVYWARMATLSYKPRSEGQQRALHVTTVGKWPPSLFYFRGTVLPHPQQVQSVACPP